VRKAAARSGYTRSRRGGGGRSGTGRHGRGRAALATMRRGPAQRRVTVMARIVRHKGAQFRSAPLARHIAYLERDGVTRDGRDAMMFDASGDAADREAFADRCADDRHHFRFIVSPEDAEQLQDLRTFTRDLMGRMEKDLETRLDWVAVDHWNTDNPHIHILLRGVAEGGSDLVVDRAYMSEGVRGRASEIATLELGPRNEREIDASLAREASAERWTGLDARLRERCGETGIVDLRPDPSSPPGRDRHLLGRAAKLEALGLATRLGPGIFEIDPRAETLLRDLGERGDIIKGVHRAMRMQGLTEDRGKLVRKGSEDRIKRLEALTEAANEVRARVRRLASAKLRTRRTQSAGRPTISTNRRQTRSTRVCPPRSRFPTICRRRGRWPMSPAFRPRACAKSSAGTLACLRPNCCNGSSSSAPCGRWRPAEASPTPQRRAALPTSRISRGAAVNGSA
jgi:type IV secretory pathway VirD2 relaxase